MLSSRAKNRSFLSRQVGAKVVGDLDGALVGLAVGLLVGSVVGFAVGSAVGLTVGLAVGFAVGFAVGLAVGMAVGLAVGDSVPAAIAHVIPAKFSITAGLLKSAKLPTGNTPPNVGDTMSSNVVAGSNPTATKIISTL